MYKNFPRNSFLPSDYILLPISPKFLLLGGSAHKIFLQLDSDRLSE